MAQVNLKINGRDYLVACEDGEEKHLTFLAEYIDQQVKNLVKSVGQVGEARLLLMASLMVADELAETSEELDALKAGDMQTTSHDDGALGEICRRIEDIAARLETS